jgi:hypothetical protein
MERLPGADPETNGEALLFAMFLKQERQTWKPRIVNVT